MEKKTKRRIKRYWYDDTLGMFGKWRGVKSKPRILYNAIILKMAEKIPFPWLKNAMLRRIGMRIGKGVVIHPRVRFDSLFPELIEIGHNSVIGYGTTILSHEFLVNEYRKGYVKIGRNCLIGALSFLLAGITIGDNAVVGAYSLVNRDVGKRELAAGVPARIIKKLG